MNVKTHANSDSQILFVKLSNEGPVGPKVLWWMSKNTQSATTCTSSFSTIHVSLEYHASSEEQDRQEPFLVRNSGDVDDDIQISALDVFQRDGWTREPSCWIGVAKKMPETSGEVN